MFLPKVLTVSTYNLPVDNGYIYCWYQDAQLKKAEAAPSQTAVVSESRPVLSFSNTSTQQEQTSVQPTEVQSETPSSGSPIDLSTKKSPESSTETTGTAATTSTTTTTSQGIVHFLFIRTHPRPLTSLLCVGLHCYVKLSHLLK